MQARVIDFNAVDIKNGQVCERRKMLKTSVGNVGVADIQLS
jgi:hypothetical protein